MRVTKNVPSVTLCHILNRGRAEVRCGNAAIQPTHRPGPDNGAVAQSLTQLAIIVGFTTMIMLLIIRSRR